MSKKGMTEKNLEDYGEVFADIFNVLLFNRQHLIEESDFSPETARYIYKADDKLRLPMTVNSHLDCWIF